MRITLTVFFDDPFYVGLFERQEGDRLFVSRVVFGAEPSDAQVADWVLTQYYALRFSPPVAGVKMPTPAKNPKRRQRQAAQPRQPGVGTKSQQALQLAREEAKVERRQLSKERTQEENARRLRLRVEKKKAKHRGH